MQLLQDVRRLFKRRDRPVEIELTGTQAERLAMAMSASQEAEDEQLDALEAGRDRQPGGGGTAGSMTEAISLVRKIGDHLDGQAGRTERLLTLMDRLPPALDSLPEIGRQNAGLLEALHDHLAQSRRRDETLSATLLRLGETTDRQTEVLGLLQQQIEVSRETTEHLIEPLGGLRAALQGLAESNARTTATVAGIEDAASRRDAELTRALTRTQRWLLGAAILCGVASAAAVITAILALAR